MLNAAIDDGLLSSNPAAKLGRTPANPIQGDEAGRNQSLHQGTAARVPGHGFEGHAPLLSAVLCPGRDRHEVREALALQVEDVNLHAKTIRIARAFSEDGALDTPKSGHGRTVDISHSLTEMLGSHIRACKQDTLKYGWTDRSSWLFLSKVGTPLDPANVRKGMTHALKAAKLPTHFTPHCLRHTYASILLADGVSPVYVQEQLGHATIELTVSTYGRWLKKKAPVHWIASTQSRLNQRER